MNIAWINEVEDAKNLFANTKVYLQIAGAGRIINETFKFSVYEKDQKYTLHFAEKNKYTKLLRSDKNLAIEASIRADIPVIYRDKRTDRDDFFSGESPDPALYHTITGMLLDKFYDIGIAEFDTAVKDYLMESDD